MIRHLISRFHQVVVLSVLLVMLATAVLLVSQPVTAVLTAPTPIQLTDGWDDPVGG